MMRAADALDRMRSLPEMQVRDAFPNQPLAILAPHPDDESLGCGGLIAESCLHGPPPAVLVLTDGTGSHPNSRAYPRDRLRALREAELLAALAHLGLSRDHVCFLGYRDTAAPAAGAALHDAAAHIARIVRETGCRTLLAPWRHDPHCDHAAAAAIAEAVSLSTGISLYSYPVWGLTLPADTMIPEDDITGFRINIAEHLARKRAAIHAHASQYAGLITDDPDGFQMQPGFIDLFLNGHEIFLDTSANTTRKAA